MTNILTAEDHAAAINATGEWHRPFGAKASGWVGEDSDFPTRYWRVGGNAVIVEDGPDWAPMSAYRWHTFIRATAHLKYPAR